MHKQFAIFTLLLLFMSTCAQNNTFQKKFVDVSLSMAGVEGDRVTNSMGIQAGIEFRLKNNVGMQCDLRYIFDVPRLRGNGYFIIHVDNLTGFAIHTDVKIYLRQSGDQLTGGYFGGQVLYQYTISSLQDNRVNRTKADLYGITGWKYLGNTGFLFEVSAGIGMQLISSYSSGKNYSVSNEFPWSKPYGSGTNIYPDLTWNIRIGWRF